ncbi:MAG TPA: nucleoside-triphosphatase [Candidatus Paceibacterota bacterium]|jgi:nucleoside-triphosphatase THEP1|nr:nucleoside-triphosphatase [Candidatus Paceibacterota bacterium]
MRKNILITGKPKSGKSTLLRKLIGPIPYKTGFVTDEIRGEHGRLGFEIVTSIGAKSVLAHVDFAMPIKVSKYSVNIENLKAILPAVIDFLPQDILYIDEIGQMQLYSTEFKNLVSKFFDAPNTCLATLSYVYNDEFTDLLRDRNDIILIDLVPDNRDKQEEFVTQLLKKIEKAKGYISQPERFDIQGSKVTLKSEHGVRELTFKGGKWACSCDFFATYGICSHAIATEEIAR